MTETGIVALVGTGTTALVAVIGLLVNARQARAAASRERRQRDYEQLMKAYEDAGESMIATVQAIRLAVGTMGRGDFAQAMADAFDAARGACVSTVLVLR